MRVMFVGGGRRVSLAKRFIAEGFEVFAYETDRHCPIREVASVIEGKNWNDKDVAAHILAAFQENSIDVAIPLADHATVVLARIAGEAAKNGTLIPSASEQANEMCLNKRVFEKKLLGEDFYPVADYRCKKVIIKPVRGFASKGIKVVDFGEMYKTEIGEDFVVQKFVDSGYEISVDAYFNRHGKMVDCVPRKRIEVQGGEVSRSITLERNAFGVSDITKLVGEKFGLVGPTCVQFIIDLSENKAYLMEINSRFGGGVILSLDAGFNMVDLIKKEYVEKMDCQPEQYNWKENFGMVRYFSESFYEG